MEKTGNKPKRFKALTIKQFIVILLMAMAAYALVVGTFLTRQTTLYLVRCALQSQVAYIPSLLCRTYLLNVRNSEADLEELKQHDGIKYILGVVSQLNADNKQKADRAEVDKNAKVLLNYYLRKGFDINQVGHDDNMTALQREAVMNNPVWVKYLVDHGADIAIKDKRHHLTALDFATALQLDNPKIDRSKTIAILRSHTKQHK